LRAMLHADKGPSSARFPEVSIPALVIMGTLDPDFPAPRDEADLIAERLHGQVVMVDGAGHYPQTEYPAETATAILALSTGSGPGSGEVTTIAE
jgi:pimeloyl-ACP methyl ester carboxylesterase